ncbi:hypothetical protein FA09DRAFT_347433 [Tilletiopsis washingtonensis]|uniref:Uncharacterized protein n=1 Tax=Tilletiopsis washingtonensis TaxID=58919 RepID=A0A316YZ60_9BASI|nr:hypothetical protein FA09DRAFT_347433 [Tilletiopsis washingtonensis]PWN94491.1 hypothetical protein FA09DRAFT_347433 [Tilletiopsis washingtonensis]
MPAAPSPSPPPPSVAGFSPGGAVPHGYSYLTRSHSLLTPSRRAAPRFTPDDGERASPRHSHAARSSSGSAGDEAAALPRSESLHASAARPALRLADPAPASPQPALARSNSQPLHSPANARAQWSRRERGDGEDKAPAATSQQQLLAAVEALPDNPKLWLPSQVALYLAHALALLPAPIIADLSAFVRGASISGRAFLRLQESDLAERGMNQRWRRLIIAAARRLRRDCLRSRIWADGDCEWPRTEDAAEKPEQGEQPGAGTQRALKQQTLKRMRDCAAVREMIQSFESPTLGELDEEGFVALPGRLRSSSSISSLRSDASSPRRSASSELAGTDGLVRQRQESFDSPRDASDAQAPPAKPWLAQLTHEELQAAGEDEIGDERDERIAGLAAVELDLVHERDQSSSTQGDEHDDAAELLTHIRDLSSSTQGSSRSSTGSFDEPQTPPPIDTDLPQTQVASTEPSPAFQEEHADVERSAAFRPRLAAGAKTNLYRASTYDAEELEALGISLSEEDESLGRFDTARRIHSPEPEAADDSVLDDALPVLNARTADGTLGRSSMRQRKPKAGGLLDLFSTVAPVAVEDEARLVEPQAASVDVAPTDAALVADAAPAAASDSTSATDAAFVYEIESAADAAPGIDAASTIDAISATDATTVTEAADSPSVPDAEPAGVATTAHDASAAGASAPVNASASSEAPAMTDAPATGDAPAKDAPATLLVPITTLAPGPDGKGSVRQRSMVMVDRRRFESLARRALLVDDMAHQLSVLERLSSVDAQAPSAELRDSRRERTRSALDDVFAQPKDESAADADAQVEALLEEDARSGKGWLRSLLDVGAIPSYAIGLGAGVGFVVITEVLGRAARRR